MILIASSQYYWDDTDGSKEFTWEGLESFCSGET